MSQIFFPSQQKKTSQAILSAFQVLFAKLLGFINTIRVFNERPLFLDFWPIQKKILVWKTKCWHFPPIFFRLKLPSLVTLFNNKFQFLQLTIIGIFNELLSTQKCKRSSLRSQC